ncbi:alpha/beta-hydrolase [Aspergillus indologenus CBS 114.80]|uniref:Alpha/beta-hydrolase n=1 Tax=Aspergillus indologenus CBS 114.80 TaxID=1450541 RepID=A0A2V5IVP6_9EURO|nr:alpha/beta-hydrolase [Aspergillus indologenus CBS 114.80]
MRSAVAQSRIVGSLFLHHKRTVFQYVNSRCCSSSRGFRSSTHTASDVLDPRLEDLGKVIRDEYAAIRDQYDAPKHPVVLAHGLLGFDTLRLAGPYLPGVQYWRGIEDALSMKGVQVITATVPPSASIEMRAEELAKDIVAGARGKEVNIIAGLDSRYMITHLRPTEFKVKSLTTIATPHRGSAVADYVLKQIGDDRLAQLYYALERLGIESGAFAQLSRDYMQNTFNPTTPDVEDVRYFSYGASVQPSFWSVFRLSHRLLQQVEGYNDGLVSVASSKWGGEGGYKGTLEGVSHLDLINWTNRLKWLAGEITGNRSRYVEFAMRRWSSSFALLDLLLRDVG